MRRGMPPPRSGAQRIDQHSGNRRSDEEKDAENYYDSNHRATCSHRNDIIAARDEKHGQRNKKATSNGSIDRLQIWKAQYVVALPVKGNKLFHSPGQYAAIPTYPSNVAVPSRSWAKPPGRIAVEG